MTKITCISFALLLLCSRLLNAQTFQCDIGRYDHHFGNRQYFELVRGNTSQTIGLDHIIFQDSFLLVRLRCPDDNYDKIDTILKAKLIRDKDTIRFVEASLGLIAKATLKGNTLRFLTGIPLFPDGCSYKQRPLAPNQLLSEDVQRIEEYDHPLPQAGYLLAGEYSMSTQGSSSVFTNGDLSFKLSDTGGFTGTFSNRIILQGTYEADGTAYVLNEQHFKFRLIKTEGGYRLKKIDHFL
jgi:hypothetical protein